MEFGVGKGTRGDGVAQCVQQKPWRVHPCRGQTRIPRGVAEFDRFMLTGPNLHWGKPVTGVPS